MKEISSFEEFQTTACEQHRSTLKKADPEMFSFSVNGISAKKPALFENSELMQS